METLPLAEFKEVIDEIRAYGGEAVKLCYECGICDTVCPWNRVTTFQRTQASPRGNIRPQRD